jgi:tRNA uridine 5-carboxymethylaminomethyl modification enzyme
VILSVRKEETMIFSRSESYIGVLVDDLVYKGVEDPYRMFTSRAEHRLLLRQDNADKRLMKYGLQLGVISQEDYKRMEEKYSRIDGIRQKIYAMNLKPSPALSDLLTYKGIDTIKFGSDMDSFIRRPEISLLDCKPIIPDLDSISDKEIKILEMEIKYEGYIKREIQTINQRNKSLSIKIPEDFDYSQITALKTEAIVKLTRHKPTTLEKAAQISGVDPSDIDILLFHLTDRAKQGSV